MSKHDPKILTVQNTNGPILKYSEESGLKILEKDGLFFKDLAHDGELHPYEDWRLSAEERASDLASRMTIEEIAGLMLYSSHQSVPSVSTGHFGPSTYEGKEYAEAGVPAYAITDQQKEFLDKDHCRHVLIMGCSNAMNAAAWNNNLQSYVEGLPLGIPVNTSSDPRHGTVQDFEFNAGAGGDISKWPEPLGLAATFNPEMVEKFGEIASREYRAMGIATALSPQIDIATEPRWWRFNGTFGESPDLSTDLARAYCDGFQNSTDEKEIEAGWGYESVNAMIKHWPGGGSGEGGRDAHYGCGKLNIYPGNNFEMHMKPFKEGAFQLKGKTKKASAVMPYYSVSYLQDTVFGCNTGNSYSKYIITDLLREGCDYDEVICTDWSITADPVEDMGSFFGGKCWGMETLTQGQRCYKVLEAGVDQFGGLNIAAPILEAYELGCQEHGEEYMKARFQKSAQRLLKNIFRTGLFENPYLDPEETGREVGCPEYMNTGFETQKKSIVMLKNQNQVLPMKKETKVYVAEADYPETRPMFGAPTPGGKRRCITPSLVDKYFTVVEDPKEADAAICFIHCPSGDVESGRVGFSQKDVEKGGNGYVPLSLQYRPYTAVNAREQSIAVDPYDGGINRSYKGKTVVTQNEFELDMVLETRRMMGDKPVITLVKADGPMVVKEFEEASSAILMAFGDLQQAFLEIISGKSEPYGLMPFQTPADMDAVEEQLEDVPFDIRCHVDSEGNAYDFAFGMNWNGVIEDDRTAKYKVKK